jgi:hypothetical protein
MKTIKLIIITIFLLVIVNSCTLAGDTYYENPERWYTETFEVYAEDWVLIGRGDEIGSYYQCVFDDFPYVDGIINVYMYQNFGTPAEIQVQLPYIQYEVEILEDGSRNPYSIQYSYDIAQDGTIAFKIHVNDYWTKSLAAILRTEYFRVTIIY